MKKIIAAVAALAMSVVAFADGITVGGRLGFDLNFFAFNGDLDLDTKVASGFDIKAFANFEITDKIGIQPELGFAHAVIKGEMEVDMGPYGTYTYDTKESVNRLDIPVLVTYKIDLNDKFFIQPAVGPKISFNLGDAKGDDDNKTSISAFNFGFVLGATFGVNAGPGSILVDARYNRDFTKVESTDMNSKMGSFQSLDFSVGYQIKL